MQMAKDVMVPMRDGVHLATDVYGPADGAPAPVLLQRLPYGKDQGPLIADVSAFVRAGYALVVQDTRGRYRSEGTFTPFLDEAADGEDTLAWLTTQPWCNGEVGMVGNSYHGATQWMAAAARSPALRAIAPSVTSDSYYDGWTYQGGALQLGFVLFWTLGHLAFAELSKRVSAGDATAEALATMIDSIDGIDDAFRVLPLVDAPVPRDLAGYYFDWLEHQTDDDFWRATAPRERYGQVTIPSLNIGGWYDCFLGGTLANYQGMKERGGSAVARRPRLIIGPWAHGTNSGRFPEASFGTRADAAVFSLASHQIRFFDRYVRGLAADVDDEPPVTLFVMGANVWREEADWPLPDTRFTAYYLHSRGHAATANGDGTLSVEPPAVEPCDVYEYDPRDPVPTIGGQTFLPGLRIGENSGPRDQRPVESRSDVLSFTTPELERDTEVTGPVELTLYAASSARDTDFTGKLVDVHPDGRAMILTEGILRARHRTAPAPPELLEPDMVYELHIDLWATANVFKAGHRIRLEVSSSNFPRFDRNTNTGGDIATDGHEDLVVATNRIYHDAARPSHVLLPLIER
jgi:putative CocE/NonD family hydrolase